MVFVVGGVRPLLLALSDVLSRAVCAIKLDGDDGKRSDERDIDSTFFSRCEGLPMQTNARISILTESQLRSKL